MNERTSTVSSEEAAATESRAEEVSKAFADIGEKLTKMLNRQSVCAICGSVIDANSNEEIAAHVQPCVRSRERRGMLAAVMMGLLATKPDAAVGDAVERANAIIDAVLREVGP